MNDTRQDRYSEMGNKQMVTPNRHERRKAQVFERKMIPANKIRGGMCAWDGCAAIHEGSTLPAGWAYLYLSKHPFLKGIMEIPPADVLRDAVLCPTHTKQLDALLKDIGRAVSGPVAGSA